ncbi:hypothetical protein GCM10023188_32800 [Pontibacter saemangeumensis]|uniref:O-antigen ligase-related domain-containing protein n=1 Tax=Pontibacter saemangeumensis TaxID=1084525 RepID=A0ABP8LVG4_9BACT
MKFNYTIIFAFPLMLVLMMDEMYVKLLAPENVDFQITLFNLLIKGSAVLSFTYSILNFQRMSPYMRFAFFLLTLYVFCLVFESYYKYSTFLVYPHVFLKLFLLSHTFFIYTFYKKNPYLNFKHIVYFILIGFVLHIFIVHPDSLSVSSFTSHERGAVATSVYMLMIPLLYFLGSYLYEGKFINLAGTFFVLLLIIFFQHRTVWICSAFAIGVLYLYIRFKSDKPINLVGRLLPVVFIIAVVSVISSAFIFSMNPDILAKFQENFTDIENYNSQGTGGWRYLQFLSYLPFIQDNLMVGMRFEGFELPIQFYQEDIDKPVFEDGNGHFFHSFYVDILFYVGMAGMLIYFLTMVHPIRKSFGKPQLTIIQIILLTFISTGFVYGISYILPPFYFGILGWCITILEQKNNAYQSYLKQSSQRMLARRRTQQLHPPLSYQ